MDALLYHSPFPHLRPLPFSTHKYLPWLIPSPHICPVFPDTPNQTPAFHPCDSFSHHTSTHSSSTRIYTDGSKFLSGTSFAVIFPSHTFRFPISPESSSLTRELCVILFTLEHFFPSSSFTVFTDYKNSLSLIHSLQPINPLFHKMQTNYSIKPCNTKLSVFAGYPVILGSPATDRKAH